jgi:tetratricopeptide (TPR) repeat protein
VCSGLALSEDGVFDSDHKLRHLPFFEEIASHEEGTSEWHSATAGLVVLRLVDSWLDEGAPLTTDDDWSLHGVRCAIDAVDEGTPIRTILGRVVDALEQQKPDIHVVVTPLMAYGRALEYEAKWFLAADVYHSVLAHLHPVEDSDASIAAHMRLGYCYRSLHLLDAATEAFTSASAIATRNGDLVSVLLARVNEGHNTVLRGNLPQAEQILDDAIARATGPEYQDVRARALHERSNVAHHRGNYELAIQFAYAGFREAQSPIERDRILNDIAVAFSELGVYSAARDAYLVLSATGQEQYTRWTATINLMEISFLTGGEMLFELYRRQLAAVNLPPLLATGYQLYVGLGYQRFGDSAKARQFLERAMALAEEHGLNQYLFQAEEALFALDAPPPPREPAREPSLDLEEVAYAIREMREAVSTS